MLLYNNRQKVRGEKCMILEEFDTNDTALFNPEDIVKPLENCPKTVVTCFANDLIEHALSIFKCEIISCISSANGKLPIYRINVDGQEIGLFMSAVGASACVSEYEELFAMSVETIVVFGTCGVLDATIHDCAIILPEAAIRDEGCSYHYVKASDEIKVNHDTLDRMKKFFDECKLHYHVGKVWTTDAPYRETRVKIAKRKEQGCICVDMECSAIAALASFRKKRIAQFFYSADNLGKEEYEMRSLKNEENFDVKKEILKLAVQLAKNLS